MRNIYFIIFALLCVSKPVFCESETEALEPEQTQQEPVAQFDENQANKFLRSVAVREVATKRAELLRELLTEKTALRLQILQGLTTSYGWQPGYSYRFDSEAAVLLQLPRSEDGVEGDLAPVDPSEGKIIHTFQKEDDLNRFNQHLEVKRTLDSQINALATLIEEQLELLVRVRDQLQRGFQIDPDRNYHYDHQAKTLYLLNAPEKD